MSNSKRYAFATTVDVRHIRGGLFVNSAMRRSRVRFKFTVLAEAHVTLKIEFRGFKGPEFE